ncbi:MAG: hypothetical protein WKG06_06645 [Segetibacter sp.]
MFRTSDDFDKSYYIRLLPQKNKLVFDMWPRNRAEVTEMVELERDIDLTPGARLLYRFLLRETKGLLM